MSDRSWEDKLSLESTLRNGDPSRFSVAIDQIGVGDQSPVQLPARGVTLIVGGNNVGKSTLLRQIVERAKRGANDRAFSDALVLSSITFEKKGGLADVYAWLGNHTVLADDPGFRRGKHKIPLSLIAPSWGQVGRDRLWYLAPIVMMLADARERFSWTEPAAKRDDISAAPTHPLHYLEDNPGLVEELDEACSAVFGQGLTLDRLSGKVVLRSGHTELDAPPIDAVTTDYRNELANLVPIAAQGDGFASSLGLLLPLVASTYPIVLVDEPEAFLHPPQAFKLGETLAKLTAKRSGQLLLATHDRNIVAGVLSHAEGAATVLRLERFGSEAAVHQIAPDALDTLWKSPSLRYTNVLDGLFHDAVVIAEHDRDCRFYSAVMDSASDDIGMSPSGLMYVPSHGLGGVPEIAEVLHAAAVPVVACLDLDGLRDEAALRRIVTSLGGQWTTEIDTLYKRVVAQFRRPKQERTREEVSSMIGAILSERGAETYDVQSQKEIRQAWAVDDPWSEVKKYGQRAFRAESKAGDRLLKLLLDQGVVLLRVGELEGFGETLEIRKGRTWVAHALEEKMHESNDATALARDLATAIRGRRASGIGAKR